MHELAAVELGPELEPASDERGRRVARCAAHASPRMRIGVEEDGALELVHGGGEDRARARRCGLKCARLSIAAGALAMRCRDHQRRVHADFARHSGPLGSTPLRQLRWNRSGLLPTERVFVGVQRESAYNVEEGCVGEEGNSPVHARMDARFKVGARGTSDADNWLHGDIKMQEISPANSEDVVSKHK